MDVVCLRCRCTHSLQRVSWRCLQESECPRCGYVGWTAQSNVTANGTPPAGHGVVPIGRRLSALR